MGRSAARARAGGDLRPRRRGPHPSRIQDPALARRQGSEGLQDRPARSVNFDEALAAILALNGSRIEVSIFDSGDVPHRVASLAGVLRGAYSITGGEPSESEGIFVRIEAGDEAASLSLDRELFTAGQLHEDGTLAI